MTKDRRENRCSLFSRPSPRFHRDSFSSDPNRKVPLTGETIHGWKLRFYTGSRNRGEKGPSRVSPLRTLLVGQETGCSSSLINLLGHAETTLPRELPHTGTWDASSKTQSSFQSLIVTKMVNSIRGPHSSFLIPLPSTTSFFLALFPLEFCHEYLASSLRVFHKLPF